jgi:hypothetical protein
VGCAVLAPCAVLKLMRNKNGISPSLRLLWCPQAQISSAQGAMPSDSRTGAGLRQHHSAAPETKAAVF